MGKEGLIPLKSILCGSLSRTSRACSSAVEHRPYKAEVGGSNPPMRTKKLFFQTNR